MWCELLSEALAALWNSSVTSDPDRWLKWNPLSPEAREPIKLHHAANTVVITLKGPLIGSGCSVVYPLGGRGCVYLCARCLASRF